MTTFYTPVYLIFCGYCFGAAPPPTTNRNNYKYKYCTSNRFKVLKGVGCHGVYHISFSEGWHDPGE